MPSVFHKGARVRVNGECGTITHIHYDDFDKAIYTVTLDNFNVTPTGYMLARECELRIL